jgi:hypothetical protein
MSDQFHSETERNKAVVQRFIEEVQNLKDWAVFDELNAPDFMNLSAPPARPSEHLEEECRRKRRVASLRVHAAGRCPSRGAWTLPSLA